MATTGEFLRYYGVEMRGNGQLRWPDEVKALVVAETLKPVSGRWPSPSNRLSDLRFHVRWRSVQEFRDGDYVGVSPGLRGGHKDQRTASLACKRFLPPTLTAIANGHPQSGIDDLLPWNFKPSS